MARAWLALAVPLALAGCVRPPKNLAGEFAPITVADAQHQPRQGVAVRWGGTLVLTSPLRDRTCFEIVSRPLDAEARPERSDETQGRFLACAPGFYEPAIYAPGRALTVVGALHGETTRKVGGYDYRYPLVDAAAVHLWDEREYRRSGWPANVGISIGGVFGGW